MTDELVRIERVEIIANPTTRSDQHPVAVYLARLSGKSNAATISHIKRLASIASGDRCDMWQFPWQTLRYQHVSAIRSQLADKYAPSSANVILAVLRGVMRECWHLGYINAEEFHRLSETPPVKGSRLPKGRALKIGEVRALFDQCAQDNRPASRRDAAILAVLFGCGLRRSEIVTLNIDDYDREERTLRVLAAKGNKDRVAHLPEGSSHALEDWLSARGAETGPLFARIVKGQRVTTERLTSQAILVILSERAEAAKVPPFSPHDLRRTYITTLLAAGADINLVRGLAGHASIVTTQRYDKRDETARKAAVDLLHVPFVVKQVRE